MTHFDYTISSDFHAFVAGCVVALILIIMAALFG
jgi:hypothetical protein